MGILVLTVVVIAVVMLAMAVGVVLKRPCLRGSCGGPEVLDPNGDPLSCEACPRRRGNASSDAPTPTAIS
jgi:hypothetical protein